MRLAKIFFLSLWAFSSVWAQNPPTPDKPPPGQQAPSRPGQPITGIEVNGRIFPPNGEYQLPEMMTISLYSVQGGLLKMDMVRAGSFSFPQVPPGSYLLKLESDGYEDVEMRFDVEGLGLGTVRFVQMSLGNRKKNGDQIQPGPEDQTVSAKTLGVPKKALKEWDKAVEASTRKETEKAISHLKKALEIYPEFSQAYNNLAVQYMRLGETDNAVAALQKSVEFEPSVMALRNLGIICLRRKDSNQAIQYLLRALEMDREDLSTKRSLGEAYFQLGQYVLALNHFRQVAVKEPLPRLSLVMGHCYLRLQLFDQAREQFQSFLQGDSASPEATSVRELVARLEKVGRD